MKMFDFNFRFDFFELPRTLVNNIYFPKVKVAFPSTELVLQFLFK